MKIKYSAYIVCLIMILSACKHTQKAKKTTAQEPTTTTQPTPIQTPIKIAPAADVNALALMKHVQSNVLPFKELSAKMKTKMVSSTINQSFTTNIRWKKGEKIWLSMSIIGIEGARVLITKDSIKIMDKLNNRYILKPLSYIKQKALVDLSFADIENIFLGQLVFVDSSKAKYSINPTNSSILSDATRFLTNVLFDKSSKNITSIFVTDKQNAQTLESLYSNYQTQMGKPFAMDRVLTMKNSKETVELTFKFQNIEAKQNLEYPFSINPNYKIEK